MSPSKFLVFSAALLLPAAGAAQHIVSARAGLVHYTEGRVLLNEKPIVQKPAQFEEVKEGEYLRTEQGRAEVLLTPGIFLRLGENSQIQMVSSRLSDVRLRFLAGSADIEADELNKDHAVTIILGGAQVHLQHTGLYRFDMAENESPQLRVFSGEALVTAGEREYHVKSKKEIELAGNFAVQKFDPEDTDALDRWSKRRSSYISAANVSSSSMAYYGYGGYSGFGYAGSGWVWNPLFGMYTFLPYNSIAWSPYGFGFYSPAAVYSYFILPRSYGWLSGRSSSTPANGLNSGLGSGRAASLPGGNAGMSGGMRGISMGTGGLSHGGGISRGAGGGGGFRGAGHQ